MDRSDTTDATTRFAIHDFDNVNVKVMSPIFYFVTNVTKTPLLANSAVGDCCPIILTDIS